MKRTYQKPRGETGRIPARGAPSEQNSEATIIEKGPTQASWPREEDFGDPRGLRGGPQGEAGGPPVVRVHEVRSEHHVVREYHYGDEVAPAEPEQPSWAPEENQLAASWAPAPRSLPAAGGSSQGWPADPVHAEPAPVARQAEVVEPPTVIWRADPPAAQDTSRKTRGGSPTSGRFGTTTQASRRRKTKYMVSGVLGAVGLGIVGVVVALALGHTNASAHADPPPPTMTAPAPEPPHAEAPRPTAYGAPAATAEQPAIAVPMPVVANAPAPAPTATTHKRRKPKAAAQAAAVAAAQPADPAAAAPADTPAAKETASDKHPAAAAAATKPADTKPVEDRAAAELGSSLQ